MCLTSHLAAKLALMGANETIAFTRVALEELLRAHGPCACGSGDSARSSGDALPSELTTAAAALVLGEPVSSVRRAIAAGVFGDPQSLKPNGKSYRVPRGAVDQIHNEMADGKTLVELAAALTPSAAVTERAKNAAIERSLDASPDGGERGFSSAASTSVVCGTAELLNAGQPTPPSVVARGGKARGGTRERSVAQPVPSLGEWRQHIRA